MDKFLIEGGVPLQGEVSVGGAKNSALPALAACLLTAEPVTLRRIPPVRDIATMKKLLLYTGAEIQDLQGGAVRVQAAEIARPEAPYELVKTMRASSLVLGPLAGRTGTARVSLPGGCAIGARPIDLHVRGLERLGARLQQEHGYIEARAEGRLRGAAIRFERITVTGTEDMMMAAVLAEGETVLENAAREPEVVDLADLLTKMGADIEGAGADGDSHSRRGEAARRRSYDHRGPDRSGNVRHRGRDYRRRSAGEELRAGAPDCPGGKTEAGGSGSGGRGPRRAAGAG